MAGRPTERDRGRGGRKGVGGVSASVVQAFIDPLSNTAQHLVVVADFPMGPVKITAGSPALPPTSRLHPHGPTDTEQSGKIKRQTEVLQHTGFILL